MRRQPKSAIAEDEPRFSWWLPLLLFAMLVGIVLVRYRWIVPALRPAETKPFYTVMDYRDTIIELTPDKARLKVTFYNFEPQERRFVIAEATYNDAPMLEPLPEVTVAPYASRVIYLTPIDPRVPEYGDAFNVSYSSSTSGGNFHSGSQSVPTYRVSHSEQVTTLKLVANSDKKPIEIRNPQLMVGKKVIILLSGDHRLDPGDELTIYSGKPPPSGFTVEFAYRLTPWSSWKHMTY